MTRKHLFGDGHVTLNGRTYPAKVGSVEFSRDPKVQPVEISLVSLPADPWGMMPIKIKMVKK